MNTLWERLDPGFLAPIWLLAGLVALVAVLLLELGARRRRNQAVRLFAASHLVTALTASVSPFKRLLKRILLLSALALLFVAMARPHLFYDWREENRSGLDILLAVDCSKSMLTEDVKPNRIERAKLAIADFADHVPDNRLGLIAFAGDAFLQCPLTLDHEAFQTSVQELDTDTIPRPGTDIATAIDEAVTALHSQPDNLKFLILVTDGEDLEGRVLDSAKAAAQSGLKIYTVGIGTPEGGTIPEQDGSDHRDASGQVVVSKLDEATLGQIASITGGAFVHLGQRGEGLEEIYDKYIAPLPKQHFEERREKLPIERFEWPLAVAILFLMWEFLTNERAPTPTAPAIASASARRILRRRKAQNALASTPLLAIGFFLTGAILPSQASPSDTAEQQYKAGDYEKALENYKQAAETQPNRTDLQYNRGDAAYKSGNYTEAEDAFHQALDTPDLKLQEDTYYNLGNSQFKHGEALEKVDKDKTIGLWEQALHSYESSLKLKDAADAKHNYDVVKQKLEQLKQQQQQQQQQQKDQNNQQQQQDKKDQSDQNSKSGQGKDQDSKQSQDQQGQGQNKPQNGGKDSSQSQQQSQGDKPDQDQKPGSTGQDKNGQQQPSSGNDKTDAQTRAYSGTRNQDKEDPGVKSRQEAENLLDSLKDDEHQITARLLNGNEQTPPPPASGKDW